MGAFARGGRIMTHLNFADAFALVGMMFAFAWTMIEVFKND